MNTPHLAGPPAPEAVGTALPNVTPPLPADLAERVRVGVAGWSYLDWKGTVYPARMGRDFDPLSYLASRLRLLEVDTTFYRIPEPPKTAEWARKVAGHEGFRFTVKLFQGFTHTRKASLVDERAFHRAVEPLARYGRLSAVLVQWPWSFKHGPDNRRALCDLLSRFSAYPLAVELRHASWAREDVLAMLREKGAAFCNIDQPSLAQCLGPTGAVTTDLAYFRFHGRNAAAWFQEGVGRDARYDYLYRPAELAPWVRAVGEVAGVAREVVVVFNNHFRGQAPANAFQFQHALTGVRQDAPPELVSAYPELEEASRTVFQRPLFG